MRVLRRALILVLCSGDLLTTFAQNTSVRSGFAIVTPVSGNIGGLVATETLKSQTASDIELAVVPPSTLITSGSFLVPLGPIGENTTAIAIANPSSGSGGVNLILTNAFGETVLNTTVVLGPLGQFSRFLNELFATQPAGFATPLLLTVSSEIPVAMVALNFRGSEFTEVPLTSLSTPTPVPVQPIPITPIPITPVLTPVIPTTPSGAGVPGFGLGLPPAPPPPMITVPPVTVSSIPMPTFSTPTTTVPITSSAGGTSALVFAQVAVGGGWSTEIAIGNTSAALQTVRIDFFGTNGSNTASFTNIVIQPRGVFFFSSDNTAGVFQ